MSTPSGPRHNQHIVKWTPVFGPAAVEVIEEADKKPFFLHINFTAPRDPLLLPPGWEDAYKPDAMPLPQNFLAEHPFDHGNFDGRDEQLFQWPRTPDETYQELAAYYAVISHMDEQIGRVLESLEDAGKLDDTIVVFTSDHRLGVDSHGLRGKQSMDEHTIGVLLIIRGPGIPATQRLMRQWFRERGDSVYGDR